MPFPKTRDEMVAAGYKFSNHARCKGRDGEPGCVFGCHVAQNGNALTNEHVAHYNGGTLRIDSAKTAIQDIINQALNQTLSRTIITSGTVFLATLSLFIFGGGVINDFAFTFLIGIIMGTYSSIYIASVIVLWWHKGQRPNIGAGAQVAVQNSAAPRA